MSTISEDEWTPEDERQPTATTAIKRSTTPSTSPAGKSVRVKGGAGLVGMATVNASITAPKAFSGEALDRRVDYRLTKMNKQIKDRLKWRSSFKKKEGKQCGARVSIDCEPEVFEAMFKDIADVKRSKDGSKLVVKMTTENLSDAGFCGVYYRYGATSDLQGPATATLVDRDLTLSFKFVIDGCY